MTNEATGRTARDLLEARGDLAKDTVAVRVDGVIYDLHTPLPDGSPRFPQSGLTTKMRFE